MTGLVDMNASFKITPDGYADRSNIYRNFLRQIALQNAMNGHTIIDEQTYLADYVGDMPVNLEGYGLHYREGNSSATSGPTKTTFASMTIAICPLPPY